VCSGFTPPLCHGSVSPPEFTGVLRPLMISFSSSPHGPPLNVLNGSVLWTCEMAPPNDSSFHPSLSYFHCLFNKPTDSSIFWRPIHLTAAGLPPLPQKNLLFLTTETLFCETKTLCRSMFLPFRLLLDLDPGTLLFTGLFQVA